jgi:hypothetical protein
MIIKIEKRLLSNGFEPSLVGFKYLSMALQECFADEGLLYNTCSLYTIVSNKCASTPSRVERGIRHSISKIEKTTNSKFIAKTFYDLKLQEAK